MKTKVSDFLEVLKNLKVAVDSRQRIEQTDKFIFNNNVIYTFNDNIAVQTFLDTGITGAIDSKLLFNFINKLSKNEEIELEQQESSLFIKYGKSNQAEFKLEEIKLQLDIDKPENWKELPEDFKQAVNTVSKAVSKNLAVPVLACIHWKDNILESCDNFRVLQWELGTNYNIDTSVFANEMIQVDFSNLHYVSTDVKDWLIFKNKDDKMMVAFRVFANQYPDLEQLKQSLQIKEAIEVNLAKSKLIPVIERALAFTSNEDEPLIKVSIDKNSITVNATTSYGKFNERVRIKNDAVAIFNIRADLFRDILDLTDKAVVSVDPALIKFETDKIFHLVLLAAD